MRLAFYRDIADIGEDKNAHIVKYGLENNSKHLYQRIDGHVQEVLCCVKTN